MRFYRDSLVSRAVVEHDLHDHINIHDEELGHLVDFVYPDLIEDGVYIDAIGSNFRGVIVDYTGLDDTNVYTLEHAPDWISIESDGLHVISEPELGEFLFTLKITSSSHTVEQPIIIIV